MGTGPMYPLDKLSSKIQSMYIMNCSSILSSIYIKTCYSTREEVTKFIRLN